MGMDSGRRVVKAIADYEKARLSKAARDNDADTAADAVKNLEKYGVAERDEHGILRPGPNNDL